MPGGVIADPQRPAKLDSRDTALIGNAKIDRPKPNGQGQMRAVHDCSSGDGGLMAAGTALADAPAVNRIKLFSSAFRAHEALGKSLTKQFLPAGIFRLISGAKFFEADRRRLCHDDTLRPFF